MSMIVNMTENSNMYSGLFFLKVLVLNAKSFVNVYASPPSTPVPTTQMMKKHTAIGSAKISISALKMTLKTCAEQLNICEKNKNCRYIIKAITTVLKSKNSKKVKPITCFFSYKVLNSTKTKRFFQANPAFSTPQIIIYVIAGLMCRSIEGIDA